MPLNHLLSAAFLATLTACTAPPPAAAPPTCQGRLRADGDQLFVTAPPSRYWRGAYLYVLAPDPPAAGSESHPRIGLVQVTEPRDGRVSWYCKPRQPPGAALAAGGLPIEEYAPDTKLRVGKCWGHYVKQNEADWKDEEVIILRIDLGEGDKVEPMKDQFEVLGDPIVDWENHMILGFERIGLCTALPFSEGPLVNRCQLDRKAWPRFTRQQWVRGGAVHLLQKEP
jgi:hypothetical protein